MADVDKCTRCAEDGLCGDARKNALKISSINDNLRNLIFRGKNATQIERMLVSFSAKIKKVVSDKFGFDCDRLYASSNNNKDGADLYAKSPSGKMITIEVKFGSYTDKAAGMEAFSKIFGTDIFSDALSNAKRKSWQKMVLSEYPNLSLQLKRTTDALNAAVVDFNKLIAKSNYKMSLESQGYMEEYLLNNSGSRSSHTDSYIRFEVAKDGSDINDVALVEKGRGLWRVKKVLPMDSHDEKARINIFAYNDETNLEIKFTLNNKNDLHLPSSGIKIRSKYMLNSPSWNVWIRKRNSAAMK